MLVLPLGQMPKENEFEEKIKRIIMERMMRKAEGKAVEKPLPFSEPVELTSSDFDDTISKYRCVVMDFWAEWCYPCRLIEPIIDRLAKKFAGKVLFARLNVNENPDIAYRYEIMGIPTVIFFVEGREVARLVGARPEPVLYNMVKERCAEVPIRSR